MRFVKLSGAGNDFVLLTAATRAPSRDLVRRLCDRRQGIGADGVLVVRRSAGGAPHKVDYFNADGSRAFCGNGTRCAAWWLRVKGAPKALRLVTEAGVVDAVVEAPERVRVRMPRAKSLRLGLDLSAAGRTWIVHAVVVGVPHAVVEVEGLGGFPVGQVGPALRRHKAFGKAGANANFVEQLGPGRFRLRTFERGVEDETLACGSGATAAALVLETLGRTALPVRLLVQGGDTLVVSRAPRADASEARGTGRGEDVSARALRADASDARRTGREENGSARAQGGLWLEGPARIVFEGEIDLRAR